MSIIRYYLSGLPIVLGEAARRELAAELLRLGVKKPLVVTDGGLLETGTAGLVLEELKKAGYAFACYSGVKTDPLDTMVDEGLDIYRREGCDGIVSVGGGSSMDTGKCISVMTVHEGRILDYARSTPNHREFKRRGCPILSLPTTSGTGSEASQFAVITNAKTHRKTTLATPMILSNSAILDPELALTVPKEVTAYTGMDAMAHAVEAYTHKSTIEEPSWISDTLALEAIRLLAGNIRKAYEDGSSMEARKQMMWGALLAGVALNIGSGETHAIGSMLAKYYGVCHGISVGIPLPYCMEYNIPWCPERFCEIAKALGADVSGMTPEEGAASAVRKMKELLEDLNFPQMSDYIRSIEEVKKFSEECAGNSCCVSNGRMTEKEAVEQVFAACLRA